VTQPSQFILQEAWRQCERHLHHLKHALRSLALPITASHLSTMTDETVQDWDQFVLRYTKLQDAIGSRLFPAVLTLLREPYEYKPMIDKLNRLEKLGYLESVDQWNQLRVVRNHFAHDYPGDDALKAAYLNDAVLTVPTLEALLEKIRPLVG
jgi:hypothetical protein